MPSSIASRSSSHHPPPSVTRSEEKEQLAGEEIHHGSEGPSGARYITATGDLIQFLIAKLAALRNRFNVGGKLLFGGLDALGGNPLQDRPLLHGLTEGLLQLVVRKHLSMQFFNSHGVTPFRSNR